MSNPNQNPGQQNQTPGQKPGQQNLDPNAIFAHIDLAADVLRQSDNLQHEPIVDP